MTRAAALLGLWAWTWAAPATAQQAETDLTAEELDGLLAQLVDEADIAKRTAALQALLEVQEGALPLVVERLFQASNVQAGLIGRVIDDYLRRTTPEPPEGSPVPTRTAIASTLHQLLIAPHEAYRETWSLIFRDATLLAMLDVIDTPEAHMEAIRFVGQFEGAFARLVGIIVRSKGDRVLPALVRSRKLQVGEVKSFIGQQLARMDKERAPLMAQVNDDQLLAEILQAIAEVHDSEGVNVMMSFINSDRPFVRKAAREALRLYERNAIWAVRTAYEDFTGQKADTRWSWQEAMDQLFSAQDAARLAPYDDLLAQGLADAAAGRFEAMDEKFATILGREPDYPRRVEMLPGLLAHGEKLLAEGQVFEARRVLRLAGYLAPEGDLRARRIRAHLEYLEGLRRRDLGFPDPQPFREASKLDPAYAKLIEQRGDLHGMPPEEIADSGSGGAPAKKKPAEAAATSKGRLALAAGLVVAALAGLVLMIANGVVPGRLRRRRPEPPPRAPDLPAAPAAPRATEPPPESPPPMLEPPPLAEPRRAPTSTAAEEPLAVEPAAVPGEEPSAAAPPSDDPYLRIEAALAKILREPAPPEPRTPPARGPSRGSERKPPEE